MKITNNGWLTDQMYAHVVECLANDMGCDCDLESINYALCKRTGHTVSLSLTHECRIKVNCDFDSIDERFFMDHLDSCTASADEICCYIYDCIDRCIDEALRLDTVIYYDQVDQCYDDQCYDDQYDDHAADYYYDDNADWCY